jgi:HEAT repeat protein
VISSLGGRREAAAVTELSGLLKDTDAAVARAATLALGAIGTTDAATALQLALKGSGIPQTIIDGILSCAEALLASNKTAEASAIYKSFEQANQPRIVRLAAARGLLACASKQG